MGQIVKRKKKGRPSKADLARRAAEAEQAGMTAPDRDVRRSLRRRNVRYTFDYDDFIDEDDEDDEEEEEDEGRREKKLKLLLKLQSKEGSAEPVPSLTHRVPHLPTASASSSDYGGKDRPSKKMDGDGDGDGDDRIDGDNEIDEDDEEVRGKTEGSKGADSAPGTPSDHPEGLPLPDKKSLELILDKLQKKDTYGVYAEPVDPEELPDYHDVIEHPMDFATVRKKLGNGSYATLEQFESDVFLICTNAMQYNAPDTIYHKQACAIQELAGKKFQRLRIAAERSDKELKSEEKTRSDSLEKKPIKKPMSRTAQEPVGSDFSSGATLATPGGFQNGSNATPLIACERLSNLDGPAEGNASLIDGVLDKAGDLSGKGLLSRFGRKSFVQDENRRATYNISNQHVTRSESIFKTFDSETKQLVAVGPHADHSYARSLARFAATLGPVAWNVASKKIEQALPVGTKFGRGWVGEYEPLPTPILVFEKYSQNDLPFSKKLQSSSSARMDNLVLKASLSEHPGSVPTFERSSLSIGVAATKPTVSPTSSTRVSTERPVGGLNLEARPLFISAGGRSVSHASANYQQQSSKPRNIEPEKPAIKQVQVELNDTPSSYPKSASIAERQGFGRLDVPLSHSRNRNVLQPTPFKQPDTNGFVDGGLPNGEVLNNGLARSKVVLSSMDGVSSQMVKPGIRLLHGQEQGLNDTVELTGMMAENAQKWQKAVNHAPVHISSTAPSVHSPRRDDANYAAAAAARAWMSMGAAGIKSGSSAENTSIHKNQISADSLYNPTREHQPQVSRFRGEFPVPGMHFQPERATFPLQAFVSPPVQIGNEAQFQNRPMVFPQLMTADLSRFQVQSPRHGLNPGPRPRQKQESLPPDLNIGFQSSGSPGRQSSQQPDLALQL